MMPPSRLVRGCTLVLAAALAHAAVAAEAPIPDHVKFNRDVRPILSDNCFHCHGFDSKQRKADRRIDTREGALAEQDGIKAIVPGKLEESDAWVRITSRDPDEMMPPQKEGKKLTDRDREIIRRWIEQGAEYEQHWAYVPPQRPEIPAAPIPAAPVHNPIDALVQARLAAQGLSPSAEADRRTLIRRLSFDLVGLPPTAGEVDAFVADTAPDAYERLVERLLASPHYGERMAIPWLDAVRFADTVGYHSDNPRNVWPYRDYVIKAFNENKRFDQFTREQLAGDLLPGSTREQKVASAFNRLLLTTEEGGAQAKDYEARMLTDRVRAIGTAWLGATIGCAQCHDHKFDPITSRDFYAMGTFFADIQEPIIGKREDGMLVTNPEQEAALAAQDKAIAALQTRLDAAGAALAADQAKWERSIEDGHSADAAWTPLHPDDLQSEHGSTLSVEAGEVIRATPSKDGTDVQKFTFKTGLHEVTALRLEALRSSRLPKQGPGNAGNGNFVLSEVTVEIDGQKVPISSATASFEQSGYPAKGVADGVVQQHNNGWAVMGKTGMDHAVYLELGPTAAADGEKSVTVTLRFDYGTDHTLGKFRISATSSPRPVKAPVATQLPKEVAEALSMPLVFRTPAQAETIAKYYLSIAPALEPLRAELASAKKRREDFNATLPRCLVSQSMAKPRTVRLLPRGNWMVETGDIMEPALPNFLPRPEVQAGRRLTRRDLADWLVWRGNPLPSRVFVNRLWKQFFGMGLSKVLDDLGAQGEPPVNPELLDWLACEFMDSGWDVKHMVRLIVTSHTYRQVSTASKELQTRDPYNRELARQSRWRLDAELVRDNALATSGLLVDAIGGPSVKPYQPDGYWENLNFPARTYDASQGSDQYRRGMYTWWQRSYMHPSLLAFDAPTREECAAERVRSNIPQQALVLLNDPTYVEAARALAAKVCAGPQVPIDIVCINTMFQKVLQRPPDKPEVDALIGVLRQSFQEYREHPESAQALLKVGASPTPGDANPVALASYTNVARVILNLHEAITRQ